MMTIVSFDFEHKQVREIPAGAVPAARAAGLYCWADVAGEDPAQLPPLLAGLGFDPAAVLPMLQPDRRTVHEVAPACLHFVVREARLAAGVMTFAALDVLLNQGSLVTCHREEVDAIARLRETYREDFLKFSKSPGFLLYEIADHLVASYRRALLGCSEAVERVQLKLFGEPDDGIFKQVAALTRDILAFRRVLLDSRELLHELAARRSPFISETTQPFLELAAGALERLGGDLTAERDVLSETLNLYMGMVSHRSNRLLKRLTMISIIFLPLTFFCGVYGMNFQFMPELHWKYAYAGFWILVASIIATLLYLMRRFKWL